MKRAEMLGNTHCNRCWGQSERPDVPETRNLALEAFIAGWGERNGYRVEFSHRQRRSTARLIARPTDARASGIGGTVSVRTLT